jgi:DNA polymerase-1
MKLFFSNKNIRYCAHNAKFELSFLRHQFKIEPPTKVWDTEVFARVEKNNEKSYSLQNCALRIGSTKHEPMLQWLKTRGHKGLYHGAPPEIIEPYVEQDAWLSWELCRRQTNVFSHWDKSEPCPIYPVVKLENSTIKHLFEIEDAGLLVDIPYCRKALQYEEEKAANAKRTFEAESKVPFVDSRKTLQPLFDARGLSYAKTAIGNASFTEANLADHRGDPIVRALVEYRAAKKRASTYWGKFLELEHNGIIHPSIHQNRAATGRMSISEPSCQNWPTDDDDPEFPIRRAFIARPECKIVSIDYSQMELRLMCDEAQDDGMIEAIRTGKDFHQETADMAGVARSLAKNGRFAKLYGAGVQRIADTLGIDRALAERISEAIDISSPRVAEYTREIIHDVEISGRGLNFLGRRYFFDTGFQYTAPNYRIQGGCSEILKMAICAVGDYIRGNARSHETCMILVIHDEILFNIHTKDLDLLPEIKRIMIQAHLSKKTLDMDVNICIGDNFFDVTPYNV